MVVNYKKMINSMRSALVILAVILAHQACALRMRPAELHGINEPVLRVVYKSDDSSPIVAHVIKIPLRNHVVQLVPALGQREAVSSIARRAGAYLAINGSNYRRGGNYNGNRVNLMYLGQSVYADAQLKRGAFAWRNATKEAVIDTMVLDVQCAVRDNKLPVNAVNQPRAAGQAVLCTDVADASLLVYNSGWFTVFDNDFVVRYAGDNILADIQPGEWIYHTENKPAGVSVGDAATLLCTVRSCTKNVTYDDYDFVLEGAGTLIRNGVVCSNELYQEFSQGRAIVHCADEVAADFSTASMQEWLIEQRHPRTAIGITRFNELCIVMVDGRQAGSEGMSLHELAAFMQELECKDALNLGGGGCSTLWVDGEVVNVPSAGEERPVSEAICVMVSPTGITSATP